MGGWGAFIDEETMCDKYLMQTEKLYNPELYRIPDCIIT